MKQGVKIIGWLLSGACVFFFVHHVTKVGLSIPGRTSAEIAYFIVAGALLYALGVVALALAWSWMLRSDVGRPPVRPLVRSYLIGQFAKYLPGNIFQYAARHGLGKTTGATHAGLLGAAVAEIYLLLCCGIAIAVTTASSILADIAPGIPPLSPWLGLLPLIAAFAISLLGRLAPCLDWLPRMSAATTATVCAGYTVFFLIFGLLYFACLYWTTGVTPDWTAATGSAAAAWIAGFVIPGPPAGAGVREAALTLGAGDHLSPATVAASIILFRLLTLGGDFLAFLSGWVMGGRPADDPPIAVLPHRRS